MAALATAPALDLVYWPVRALAEPIRLTLAYGKVPFKSTPPTDFFGAGWGAGGKDKATFGQLPALGIGGDGATVLAQAPAIARYCAELAGIAGADVLARARADEVSAAGDELRPVNRIVNVYVARVLLLLCSRCAAPPLLPLRTSNSSSPAAPLRDRDAQFEKGKAEYFADCLPRRLKNLSRYLGDKPFFTGDKICYGDFNVWHHLDNSRTLEPTCLAAYPNIVAWMSRIEALDGVKEYLATRPTAVGIGTKPMLEGFVPSPTALSADIKS